MELLTISQNGNGGGISTSDGSDAPHNYRIRSRKIYFREYDGIYLVFPQEYQYYLFVYDESDTLIYKYGWGSSHPDSPLRKSQWNGASYLRFIIQSTSGTTTVVPLEIANEIKVYSISKIENRLKLLESSKGVTECYVSTGGSDEYDGTLQNPFATIQHAIDSGFKNICVKGGYYFNHKVVAENIDDLHVYAYNGNEYTTVKEKTRPIFCNGQKFDTFSTDENGYKYFTLSNVPSNYTKVFINHSVDPIITGNYPSFRAGLWSNHSNKYDDVRLKPVLTYEELSEVNTFFFDGTNVYFNVSESVTGVTVVSDESYVFNLTNCNGFEMNGIDIMYGDSTNLNIVKCCNAKISNCRFGYTMRSNCVTANYSDVEFNNCEAFKATVDGFNSHYYGVSVYNDCIGSYNYDDGESSHEYCEVIVHGGEYAYNGKGGHAPINGCKFKCDGTYTHDNGYGFYMVGGDSFKRYPIKISNSVALNNTIKDIQNTLYDTILFNCKYETKQIGSAGGTITDLTQ